jgi:hypothetical protein
VAVLLVSPHFLASDFIVDHELPPLLEAARKEGLVILWLHLSSCLYDETEIKHYQAVHDVSKPMDSLRSAAQAQVLAGVCRQLKAAANPSISPSLERPPSAAGPEAALSNLPERNPFFTDREPELAQLHEALAAQGRAALSGLGGVGKTQTALEYAYRHLEQYDHTFWVSAVSREALLSGYMTIAGLLKLPEAGAQDQALAVRAVQRWLESHERWLLILDDADDLATAREFIPPVRIGHALLTSRTGPVATMARGVKVQEMAIEEGVLLRGGRAAL